MSRALVALSAVAVSLPLLAVNPCDLKFTRLASRRFVLDNELTLCEYRPNTAVADTLQYPVLTNGLRVVGGYWPAAHYRARVTALPAEIAFATASGDVKWRFPVEGKLPKPPFDFSVLLTCSHKPAVLVTKDGKTTLLRTVDLPDGFNPRLKSNLVDLKFCVGGNVSEASASLTAGVGQADVRFVTTGRENKLYMENGRAFFTFSSRAYGTCEGVASFDPSLFDVRLEGVILFDYGDGQLRNDTASHIFYDGPEGGWKGYGSNFSTGSDSLGGRATGGLNAIWSKKNPLHGLSVMHAKSLGLSHLNEDPCATYDAEARKWRLFLCEMGRGNGIKAGMYESEKWDGPFTRIAGPVKQDSTGTTISWIGGKRYCFSGSSDRACYVYSYPDLGLVGKLDFDFPPWNDQCRNGRVWPCVAELPDGYPFRYILLTMDRANFPGMPNPSWTYGALCLYGAQ